MICEFCGWPCELVVPTSDPFDSGVQAWRCSGPVMHGGLLVPISDEERIDPVDLIPLTDDEVGQW